MKKRLVVIGAGESGVGAALLGKNKGYDVFVTDNSQIKDNYKSVLLNNDIRFEENKHSIELILSADLIVKSPGIPDNIKFIQEYMAKNPNGMISEIEFASRYTKAKLICISGSNGKTTTSSLLFHILKKAGLNVCLAGNIGKSFAWQLVENDCDYFVLEISSFQLDGMFDFKADIAILLNITPDHLDRYDNSFEKYVESKFRIVRNQKLKDSFIYCKDDKAIAEKIGSLNLECKTFPFSLSSIIEEGAYLKDDELIINVNNKQFSMNVKDLTLQGKHNIYNSMAAIIAARALDISKESIKLSLSDFQNVEHRLEFVANVHGIEFINDSKATNVNAVWYALESIQKPIIWIAGGKDKGNEYEPLIDLVAERVKAIVCLGTDNSKIIKTFKGVVSTILDTKSMDDAIKSAYLLGQNGDVVLLSPACASFDLFEDYIDRGNQFKQYVRSL